MIKYMVFKEKIPKNYHFSRKFPKKMGKFPEIFRKFPEKVKNFPGNLKNPDLASLTLKFGEKQFWTVFT